MAGALKFKVLGKRTQIVSRTIQMWHTTLKWCFLAEVTRILHRKTNSRSYKNSLLYMYFHSTDDRDEAYSEKVKTIYQAHTLYHTVHMLYIIF